MLSLLGVTAKELLEIKSKDWKYEKEMRQVLIDTRPMNKLFFKKDLSMHEAPDLVYYNDLNAWLLTVDFENVNKIYLGSNFDTKDKSNQRTIKILQGKKIPIYKMSLKKDRYSLKRDKYVPLL